MARLPKVKRGRKPRGFPSIVHLYGCKIQIFYCHMMPREFHDSFGVAYLTEKVVMISLDQSKEEMERTLFHELCHMLLFLSGHHFKISEEDEEAIIRALEHGFLQMYKRRSIT